MSAKVYIHIGLPKTATTALQKDFFPYVCGDAVNYVGVFQDRGEHLQTELYGKIVSSVNDAKFSLPVKKSMQEFLDESGSLLLSEEMFTVSDYGISWREKLYNLKKLIDYFDSEIIVTVRNPAEAMFSYYVELCHRLGGNWSSFVECALHDEAMEIFHYEKLLKELILLFGKNKIHIYKFEDIINNKLHEIYDVICCGKEFYHNKIITKKNTRISNRKNSFSRNKIGIAEFYRRRFFFEKRKIEKKNIFIQKIFNYIVFILNKKIKMRQKIRNPSQDDFFFINQELSSDNTYLKKHFNISY